MNIASILKGFKDMCGRFALYSGPGIIDETFSIREKVSYTPSYNVAPTQEILVVCQLPEEHRVLQFMRWGLIPFWQKENQKIPLLINARAETLNTKPAFRKAVLYRRCLIIADGFYEWHSETRQPYYFHKKDNKPLAMAGIWEQWSDQDKKIVSCAIITSNANKSIQAVHHRMPVIIHPDDYNQWLDLKNNNSELINKMLQRDMEDLELYPVTRKVSNSRYNAKDCIQPIENSKPIIK